MARIKSCESRNKASTATPDSVIVGLVVGMKKGGQPMVSFPGCDSERGIPARSTAALGSADIGRQVALLFEFGDPRKPMVIGKIQVPSVSADAATEARKVMEAKIDGERLILSADREIELRCGKASITLTRAGKVIIKGAYLLNRSSGVNKIKGASVQIN